MSTATRDPNASRRAETLTRRDASGAIYTLSTDQHTEYRIDLAAQTCQCRGFQFRGTCRHLCAAQARYQPSGQPCHICGNPNATGHDYRRIGGGRDLDLPCCRLGEGHCA